MVRYLTLLFLIGLVNGQDILVAVDGKEFKGRLIQQEDKYLFFLPDGLKETQKIPIRLIKEIRIGNKTLDFGNDLVISVAEVSDIKKNIDKREGDNQNIKNQILSDNHINFLSPKIIASRIKASMISYEDTFTGIKPFLKYYGSSSAIGYLGLRFGESIQKINETDGDVGNFLIFSPSLIGVGYIGYLKNRHQRNFWGNARKSFIELTSNIDLSSKIRLELYNEQLSYLAAKHYLKKPKPYENIISRVISSFILTYSLVNLENIILGDYFNISNDILYISSISNFIFIAPLIDKVLQKRYYEKEKLNYISGLDDYQKSIFSSRFDEIVKTSSFYNTNFVKANKNYQFSYFSSMCALAIIFLMGAISDAPFTPGQV